MKKVALIIIALLFARTMQAQTFAEWFQQTKTQKKYLAEQIVALQAYAEVLKKDYNVAQKGLGAIGDIKNGDFNLHSAYFNSLKSVNPEVAKYPRASDILSIQQSIQSVIAASKSKVSESHVFAAQDEDYISSVYSRLSTDCLATLNELEAVTTPGKLEMKDDERISRIDKLYKQSQSQYSFSKSFSSNLLVMINQKNKEDSAIQAMHQWYGIQ